MRILVALAAVAAWMLLSGTVFASCTGRIEGELRVGGGEYSPFDALDFRRRQTITLRNTGTETCDFVVGFQRQPAEGSLSKFLKYTFEDVRGQSLLSDLLPPNSGTHYLLLTGVSAGQTASTDYDLVLSRGQFAFPGTFQDDQVTASLHLRSASGAIASLQQDTKPVAVTQIVKASVDISIAGGGLKTTLDFGELRQGAARSVVLNTRANYAYSLVLRSANGGVLKLRKDVSGQNWTVPYSLQVDSRDIALGSPVTIKRNAPKYTWGRESHSLAFLIGDASDRMAGLYADEVTVEILVAP